MLTSSQCGIVDFLSLAPVFLAPAFLVVAFAVTTFVVEAFVVVTLAVAYFLGGGPSLADVDGFERLRGILEYWRKRGDAPLPVEFIETWMNRLTSYVDGIYPKTV